MWANFLPYCLALTLISYLSINFIIFFRHHCPQQYTLFYMYHSCKEKSNISPFSLFCVVGLDAPINLQVVGQTDNTVTLEWTNSQADVDRYRVKFSPVSGTAHGEDLFPEGSDDKTQATITSNR